MLIPISIENIIKAIMLSLVSNLLKSLTLTASTVLSKKLTSSLVTSSAPFSTSFIATSSLTSTNLNALVDTIPTNTLTIEVNANTSIIVVSILPILLGCFIFPIDVLIVKKISGTIITSNIFKNKSPNGLNTVAFSPNISPTIVPIIIDAKSINVDL